MQNCVNHFFQDLIRVKPTEKLIIIKSINLLLNDFIK